MVAAALVIVAPSSAQANEVSSEELRSLAERAQSEPAALQELLEVEAVDGKPFEATRLLAGLPEDELEPRLEVLASEKGEAPAASAGQARAEAGDILDGPPYEAASAPQPFRGVLERVGRWLRSVFDDVDANLPGGPEVVWELLAAIVLVIAFFLSRGVIKRRVATAERSASGRAPKPTGPRDLERAAQQAERAGDLDAAIRLRFQAGVLRLQEAGVLPRADAITTGEVNRRLRSRTFSEVAGSFEQIAYGGKPARPTDVELARSGWSAVLAEAGAA